RAQFHGRQPAEAAETADRRVGRPQRKRLSRNRQRGVHRLERLRGLVDAQGRGDAADVGQVQLLFFRSQVSGQFVEVVLACLSAKIDVGVVDQHGYWSRDAGGKMIL